MGRRFTLASGNYIHIGTAAGLAGFDWRWGTVAVVFNLATLPGASLSADMFATNVETGASIGIGINTVAGVTGVFYYDGTNGVNGTDQAITGVVANVTYLLAITKGTGSVIPRAHLYVPSTNTWTHAGFPIVAPSSGVRVDSAANTSLTLGAADNSGSTSFGVDGEIFAVAAWPSYAMSDLEVEKLAVEDWGVWNPGFYDLWDTSRDNVDMSTSLGRYRVKQTARVGSLRGTVAPPPKFRSSPVRHRR